MNESRVFKFIWWTDRSRRPVGSLHFSDYWRWYDWELCWAMINVICVRCNVWWSVLGVKSLLSAMTNLRYHTRIDLWRIRQRYISYSYRQQKRWTKMQRHVFARCYCTTQLASPGSATPLDYNALNVWCLQTLSLSETAQVLSVI